MFPSGVKVDPKFQHLNDFPWWLERGVVTGKLGALHRIVANAKPKQRVKFINGNKLDCRACNLRIVGMAVSLASYGPKKTNKNGYRGVSKSYGKYLAAIHVRGQQIRLGRFLTAVEAAKAWNRFARFVWGSAAYQNPI